MSTYISIYAIIWFLAILTSFKIKKRIYITILTLFIIICFQGCRWRTGSDWQPYFECFEVSNVYKVNYVEFGYYWYNRIVRYFTDSYSIFLLIQSATIYGCILKFSYDFKAKNLPAIMGAFFATTIFPVRFTLACSIFLLGYKYIRDRQFIKFLIVWIVALSFHQIVALTFPLYFIAEKNYKNKIIWTIYISCCLIGLLTELVFGNLVSAFNMVFAYLPQFSQDKAAFYLNQENEARSLISNIISYLNGGIFIFIFLIIRNKFKNINDFNVLLNMYVFGLSISRIFLNTIPYLSRINLCCTGGFSIMLLFGIYKFKKLRPVLIFMFACYEYLAFKGQINNYPDLFLPYFSFVSISSRPIVY